MSDKNNRVLEVTENRRRFIINVLYFTIIVGIVILFMRYVLNAIMPFFIAFVISLVLRPIVRFLNKYCKVSKKFASIVLVVVFFSTVGFAAVIASISLIEDIKDIGLKLPEYFNEEIIPLFTKYSGVLNELLVKYDINFNLNEVIATVGGSISKLSTSVFKYTGSLAVSVPGLIVDTIICVVSTYFFTADMDVFKKFIERQLSDNSVNIFNNVRTHFKSTIWNYIRSYALIVLITYTELIIGFLIIGIKNPFVVAFIIAIFDILPIVGCGTILLPWLIIALFQGNTHLTLGLLILYIVITVIRNIMEPKIVGDQVGLHPLVTLFSMIVGSFVFGPLGLLGFPVALVIIKDLNEEGVIKLFKNKESIDKAKEQDIEGNKEE